MRADVGDALAAELGNRAAFAEDDETNAGDWKRIVAIAEDRFGPVTVLVNNAGILGPMAKTADVTEADYMHVCAVTQHSIYPGMHAVIPSTLQAGKGSLVDIYSIDGLAAYEGCPSLAFV